MQHPTLGGGPPGADWTTILQLLGGVWVTRGGHAATILGVAASAAQIVWQQSRAKPIPPLQWLKLGLAFGIGFWGMFVPAIPAGSRLVVAIFGGSAWLHKDLRILASRAALKATAFPPTSHQAFGEPEP
jgi:hypothetical protein